MNGLRLVLKKFTADDGAVEWMSTGNTKGNGYGPSLARKAAIKAVMEDPTVEEVLIVQVVASLRPVVSVEESGS